MAGNGMGQAGRGPEARPVHWSLIVMAITLSLLLLAGLCSRNVPQRFFNWLGLAWKRLRVRLISRRRRVFLTNQMRYSSKVQSLCSLVHRQLSFTVYSHYEKTCVETKSPLIILNSPGLIQANVAIPLASSAIFFEFKFTHLPFHSNLTLGLAPKDDSGTSIPESAYRRFFIDGIVVNQTYIRPLLIGDRVGCIYDQRARTVCFLHNGNALPAQALPLSLVNRRDLRPTVYTDHSCSISPNFDKFIMPFIK